MNIENCLVIIPARGGSKGVPGKNIKPLAGKPLIYYTIEAARQIFSDENIIVSTDDVEIKICVEKTGLKVPFLRPTELATDTAGSYEVIIHAVQFAENHGMKPEVVLLLQATTPFRTANHILEAMQLVNEQTEMVVSVKETRSNPYYVLFEENEMGWLEKSKKGDFTARQQCPKVYEYNGGIYFINVVALKQRSLKEFTHIKKYVMDEWSSHDIDTMFDWEVANVIVSKLINK